MSTLSDPPLHPDTHALLAAVARGGFPESTVERTAQLLCGSSLADLSEVGRASLVSFWTLIARAGTKVIDYDKLEQALDAVAENHPSPALARVELIDRVSAAITRNERKFVLRRTRARQAALARERRLAAVRSKS